MADVNEVRGEAALTLAGVEYALRPSFEAILAFEKQCGVSQYQLAEAASVNALSLEPMSVIVAEMIKAHARSIEDAELSSVRAQRIGQLIHETGVVLISKRLALILMHSAMGGYNAAGEAKAVGTDMQGIRSAA